jgi:lipopolysaccharide/colanic/teichoic acid biosynthesis glycosyltransferase
VSRKRLFDVGVTSLALPLLAPLFLAIAMVIRVTLGAPVIFRQRRSGRHGRPFTLLKFRTMTDTRGTAGDLLPDADRLTKFGRFLRATSLDELPELINVLRGDMSLVGPRPLLLEYLALYTPGQARRHDVRPGITGWAQINGRNTISWERKFELDVWYIEHQSAWLDLRILAETIPTIFRRKGISERDHVTARKFSGGGA